jgi:hypothetical protein
VNNNYLDLGMNKSGFVHSAACAAPCRWPLLIPLRPAECRLPCSSTAAADASIVYPLRLAGAAAGSKQSPSLPISV